MPLPQNPNTFANFPLDKSGHRRKDAAWLADALDRPDARVCLLQHCAPLFLDQNGERELAWLGGSARALLGAHPTTLFLGVDDGGAPVFALEAPAQFDLNDSPLSGLGGFENLRAMLPVLSGADAAIVGCAKSLLEWHARHRFCANCGAPSALAEGGWKRECSSCNAEHFPRVDPVVIMLPVRGESCALGRQKHFPRGMWSALAGYIEPGESIEEAVARETLEEAGLKASAVRLHSSQPWPFPSSLMIGAICEVEDGDILVDQDELEDARWFSREDVAAMVRGEHKGAWAPPPFAIAHQLLKTWSAGG